MAKGQNVHFSSSLTPLGTYKVLYKVFVCLKRIGSLWLVIPCLCLSGKVKHQRSTSFYQWKDPHRCWHQKGHRLNSSPTPYPQVILGELPEVSKFHFSCIQHYQNSPFCSAVVRIECGITTQKLLNMVGSQWVSNNNWSNLFLGTRQLTKAFT